MERNTIFEQPATEQIRFCLKLEHLQHQLQRTQMGTGTWDSYHCVCTIIDVLRLLDRHDLRTKLNQELSRLLMTCKKLQHVTHIDKDKLAHLQSQIDHLCTTIHQSKGMFAQELRDNEFLQTIYRHHAHPGGTCKHQTPELHLWLTRTTEERHQDIKRWLQSFDDIFAITGLILRIIRDSGIDENYRAESGFFQMPLDRRTPVHMVRLQYPGALAVFPKISMGHHGVSVRFVTSNGDKSPEQTPLNIDFIMTLCHF